MIAASALAIGFSLSAAAQTATASDSTSASETYSTSNLQALLSPAAFLGGTPGAEPAPKALASPQYGNQRSPQYPGYESKVSRIAFVGGGGFSAPVGNDTHGFETWGYNFDVGGGWNFSKKVGILFEYQFDRMKIPGSTLANAGVEGGNINSHLFLFDPVYYYYNHRTNGAYITGGAGFSRKVTNFTDLEQGEECYYFCYYVTEPVTVASFSSNQLAADAGLGFYWKAFGQDSNGKLFVEARYVFVDSPRPNKTTEGEGTEGLIPVTIGIRF
ncbi:MAG: hypothetical protein WA294_13945 [Acidobacteriaceae bacterium]